MIPEFYRSFETSTLKDLVSYGDPVEEEPRTEARGRRDDEAPPRRRVLGRGGRSRPSLRRKKGKWLRLGRRMISGAEPR
jgi:hypothetical protein